MSAIQDLLGKLWKDYKNLNVQPQKIQDLLLARGETITNDHIALRTFDLKPIGLDALAAPFVAQGYSAGGSYDFPDKKLSARHFQHADPSLPLVFISELRTGDFSPKLLELVKGLVAQIPADLPRRSDFPVSGRSWNVSYADYEALRAESEYAAWVAAFGFRANHFTVLVNSLKSFAGLEALNEFLKDNGFRLNAVGGEIKGSPAQYLEQSSTLADRIGVNFSDGRHVIPACYYEFARRYTQPDGKLFRGFIESSATKIFESTHKG